MSNILIIILMSMTVITATDAEVVNRTEYNEWGLKSPIIIAYFKFNSKTTSKMGNYWRNRMQVVSEDHKDLVFAVSDSDQYINRLYDYGFEFDWKTRLESEPIVIAEDYNEFRYLLDSKLTAESLQKFVKQFKDKQLVQLIKSQPIPDNSGTAVKEVVGKTFESMVIYNPKDVFILMYAHWCGHCKKLVPIWKSLSELMADEPNVDILQMDVTENEVRKPFKTMNYPTIYWIPFDDKYSPKKYLGKRSVDQFIQYISQMASKPLLKYGRDGQPIGKGYENEIRSDL